MVRAMVYSLAMVVLCGALAAAAEKEKATKKAKKEQEAKIVKVNPSKGTVTVRLKNKEGKEIEKTFKLMEDAEYMDSTGKVATMDVFTSGDWVLIVEREGKIAKMKKKGKLLEPTKKSTDKQQ